MNWAKKVENICSRIQHLVPDKSKGELALMFKHCSKYKYGELRELSSEESLLYSWLCKNTLNPRTVSYWFSKVVKPSNKHYRKEYSEKIKKKYFMKLMNLKDELSLIIPKIDEKDYQKIIVRCKRYKYNEITKLNLDEQRVYNFLESKNLNPATVYRWLMACKLPEQLKESLLNGNVSRERAVRLYKNKERQRKSAIAWQIIEEAKKIINEVV